MTTIPTFTPPGGASSTFDLSAGQLGQAASIQGQGKYQLGALDSQFTNQDQPDQASAAGAAGQWYSGARKVAAGNQQRQFQDKQFNIYSGMFDAMNQMTMNQGAAATGFVVA